MRRILLAFPYVILLGTVAAAQFTVEDEFNRLDGGVWCPCQIDAKKGPLAFPDDKGDGKDHVVSIPIKPSIRGENDCNAETECPKDLRVMSLAAGAFVAQEDELPESLGPNFVDRFLERSLTEPQRKKVNPYCKNPEADECMQRPSSASSPV